MQAPRVWPLLCEMGLEVREFTPVQFGAEVKKDMDRWTSVVKAAGISLDE